MASHTLAMGLNPTVILRPTPPGVGSLRPAKQNRFYGNQLIKPPFVWLRDIPRVVGPYSISYEKRPTVSLRSIHHGTSSKSTRARGEILEGERLVKAKRTLVSSLGICKTNGHPAQSARASRAHNNLIDQGTYPNGLPQAGSPYPPTSSLQGWD